MSWQGTRQWAGPEAWASPLYDWSVDQGKLKVSPAANRLLQNTVWRVEDGKPELFVAARLTFVGLDKGKSKQDVWAGFAVGIQGLMDDQRHILVGPKGRLQMGVRADGKLFIANEVSKTAVDLNQPVVLEAHYINGTMRLEARSPGVSDPRSAVRVQRKVNSEEIVGNIGLAVDGPEDGEQDSMHVQFEGWSAKGEGLTQTKSNAFGPILWSQYTRQGNNVKALAMIAPMGEDDAKSATLQIKVGDEWKAIDTQDIDPLTYSVVFRATIPDGEIAYRVKYNYLGHDHFWPGMFIPDPATTGEPLKIGVFSCDHGYAFPLPTMVENVKKQKPNLVYFAGDQIYENYGGFELIRTPTKLAMLDYLRKYYQFGWTWRDVLANTPSVIIPDDHDVFQGNIWGAGGVKTENMTSGGYVMDPEWVNGIQRTQTASLPDPVDPTPVEQGISVYYTEFNWGGLPIVVIEDRKWKSGPRSVMPKGNIATMTQEQRDPPGAQLLGDRQEAFLKDWSKRSAESPLRFILSQTIFCEGTTNAGAELKPSVFVTDTNGWPHSGRQRALSPFKDGKTFMLHGDQHMGLLVRHGVDQYKDGPYAFMVPGTSNGYPRAWWPNGPEGKVEGDFVDSFGNLFTVFAAANPEPGTNKIKSYAEGKPEETAHHKGSGYGLVVVDPKTHAVTFNMYRYFFDADKPTDHDQFLGFPVTIKPE